MTRTVHPGVAAQAEHVLQRDHREPRPGWTLSLVDPDNRRPVDWEVRRRALEELRAGAVPDASTIKLFVIWKALELRARRAGAFAGSYEPVEAGPRVCAFVRGGDVLVAVPLFVGWEETTLEGVLEGRWRDVFTGAEVECAGALAARDLVGEHPFAVLERL